MDDHAPPQIGRATWWLVSFVLVGAGLALGSGLYEPEPPHPCEVRAARDPASSDLDGCLEAWDARPAPGRPRGRVEGQLGESPTDFDAGNR